MHISIPSTFLLGYGRIHLVLNKTLTDDTSVKRAQIKTFLFWTNFVLNKIGSQKVFICARLMEVLSVNVLLTTWWIRHFMIARVTFQYILKLSILKNTQLLLLVYIEYWNGSITQNTHIGDNRWMRLLANFIKYIIY